MSGFFDTILRIIAIILIIIVLYYLIVALLLAGGFTTGWAGSFIAFGASTSWGYGTALLYAAAAAVACAVVDPEFFASVASDVAEAIGNVASAAFEVVGEITEAAASSLFSSPITWLAIGGVLYLYSKRSKPEEPRRAEPLAPEPQLRSEYNA